MTLPWWSWLIVSVVAYPICGIGLVRFLSRPWVWTETSDGWCGTHKDALFVFWAWPIALAMFVIASLLSFKSPFRIWRLVFNVSLDRIIDWARSAERPKPGRQIEMRPTYPCIGNGGKAPCVSPPSRPNA